MHKQPPKAELIFLNRKELLQALKSVDDYRITLFIDRESNELMIKDTRHRTYINML